MSDRKRKLWGRTKLVEQQGLDAARRKDAGRLFGKFRRKMAAVVRDRNTAVHGGFSVGYDQVGQALSGLSHGKTVHAVEAYAKHAAQAGCSKGQRGKKAAFDLFLIFLNGLKLRALVLSKRRILQPTFVFCNIVHWYHLIL